MRHQDKAKSPKLSGGSGMGKRGRLGLLLWLLCAGMGGAQARDRFDRPSLEPAGSVNRLTIAFAEPGKWDGKHIDRTMQCRELGGDKPASAALLVTDVPAAATSLVVYFANPRSFHNHGTFRVRDRKEDETWKVPGVLSGAQKLPKGIEVFDGGSSWGRAYNAPCPTQGSWLYTVTVYALDDKDGVLAVGEKELGYAP